MRRIRQLAAFFAPLMRHRGGNVAVFFALAVIPIMFAVGAAIDYSGVADLHVRLQRATDATALQLCQMSRTTSQADRQQAATTALTGYLGTATYKIDTLNVTASPYQVYLLTRATFTTSIVTLMGPSFRTIDVTADAQCQADQQTFEIALVLDNTGSMAESSGSQSKIDALKAAATNFVNFIYNSPALSQAKISIVPFAAAVAVDPTTYRNATWIDQAGKASYHWSFVQPGTQVIAQQYAGIQNRIAAYSLLKSAVPSWDWTGCLESLPYPYNVQDVAPVSGKADTYYVPMLAPDESGAGGASSHTSQDPAFPGPINSANSYIDDTNSNCGSITAEVAPANNPGAETFTNRYCKYQSLQGVSSSGGLGPNFSCTTRPLTRLTSDKTLILNEISKLTASGNTNIHEGFMWGWRTLSPNSVFADGVAYTKPLNNKIVVLMTDGTNTWDTQTNPLGSKYSAYGFFKNPDGSTPMSPVTRLIAGTSVPTNGSQARSAIDALTLAACKNAAAASSSVQIFTIGFSVPSDPIDTQGLNLLNNCATGTGHSYVANDSTGLMTAFQKIADSIGGLRLTQ